MVEVGEQMPNVKLVDTELKSVKLPKEAKGKPAVLAFFPGAFTGVCTKELCTFRDSLSKLGSFANLYAISVDGPFANRAFKERNSLNFPILSDYRRKAVKAFDIVFKDFAKLNGYKAAKRAVFITDSSGAIRYKWVTEDPTVEPNYAEIETALSSIK